jgi:hypothetical protein
MPTAASEATENDKEISFPSEFALNKYSCFLKFHKYRFDVAN